MKGKAAESFEDLDIYQRARELGNAIYVATKGNEFGRDFGLIAQIRRAVVSIISNIAKASCGEVRAQLQIARDQNYIAEAEYGRLYELCKQINGMISNFIPHLQTSNYQGEKNERPKRLISQNDKTRWRNFSPLRESSCLIMASQKKSEK